MRKHTTALVASVFVLTSMPALAHQGAPAETPAPTFKLEKLTDRAWCLFGQGGNVAIYATGAGVVVVDDQYETVAQGIVDQIRSVTTEPIRYLVNTHYHADHTGGNPVFIKLAEIVAHDTVRSRLLEYPEQVKATFPARIEAMQKEIAGIADPNDPYRVALEKDVGLGKFFLDFSKDFKVETAAPPGITFDRKITLWTGGRQVDILHAGPGHTDGDAMVYLRDEKVLHMGDLFFNGMYPFVDTAGGGSVAGIIRNIDAILGVVPADVRVIPGHGPVTDLAGLRRARSFLAEVREKVKQAVGKGMSRVEAVRTIRMDEYPDIKPSFRSLGNVVLAAYDELAPQR
ncbi:MAG: MBL fold metallo-hydrolase [Candidatus Polarisedimenticolia bacterium]